MAFGTDLKRSSFLVKLYNKKPKTMADVLQRAYEAMEIEEVLKENFQVQRSQKASKLRNFRRPSLVGNDTLKSNNYIKPLENQRETFLNLNKKRMLPPPRLM